MTKPSLAELQEWMRWIITEPHGVEHALKTPNKGIEWIAEIPPLSKPDRLSIYAEGYFMRLHDSLQTDFPRTAKLLGDKFRALAMLYFEAFPSRSFTLGELGRRLPGFVAEHPIRNFSPMLSDLVLFEWLENECFWNNRQRPITAERLTAQLSEHAPDKLCIVFNDSVRGVTTRWSLGEVWTDFDPLKVIEGEYTYVFHRPDLQVHLEPVSQSELVLLERARGGTSLGDLFENTAIDPQEIQTIFAHWTEKGWIVDLAPVA